MGMIVEDRECDHCYGTGKASDGSRCWHCLGYKRHLTALGREMMLFLEENFVMMPKPEDNDGWP